MFLIALLIKCSLLTPIIAIKMECDGFTLIFPETCNVADLEVTKNETLEYNHVYNKTFSFFFKDCKFAMFPFQLFADFPKITSFNMINNGLRILNGKFFTNANNVKSLAFRNNSITTLKNKVFFKMTQLTYLEIFRNKISFIAVNALMVTFGIFIYYLNVFLRYLFRDLYH